MRRPAIGVNERGGDSAGHAAEVLVLDKKIGRWHPQRRMIRTDLPDYPAALRDVACVLRVAWLSRLDCVRAFAAGSRMPVSAMLW
jgi:hypothetical protein